MGQDALACYLCFSGSVSCGEGTHMLEQHCIQTWPLVAVCSVSSNQPLWASGSISVKRNVFPYLEGTLRIGDGKYKIGSTLPGAH